MSNTSTATLDWCNDSCADPLISYMSLFIAISTILTNITAVGVIMCHRGLRHSNGGMLMTSMCICGVIESLVVAAFSFCETAAQLTEQPCVVIYLLSSSSSTIGVTTIAGLAVDRFIAVSYHMRYPEIFSPTKCRYLIGIQWAYCVIVNLTPVLDSSIWCVKRFGGCGFQGSLVSIGVLIGAVLVPSLVAMILSYTKIWIVMNKLRSQTYRNDAGRRTGIRTTLLISVTFLMCVLPRTVYAFISGGVQTAVLPQLDDLSAVMFQLSSVSSTLIYCGTNKTFKHTFKRILRCPKNEVGEAGMRKVSPGVWTIMSQNT